MMFNKKIKQIKKITPIRRQGFSIGEVVLSVFVLGIIALSIITMYVVGLNEITDERDNVIAALLAQEGVELVRNIRDDNWVTGGNSFNGIGATTNCSLDYSDNTCGGDFMLNYNGTFYVQGGIDTKFKRRIQIIGSGDNRTVTSLVTWNSSGNPPMASNIATCTTGNKCVFSESVLTEWGE